METFNIEEYRKRRAKESPEFAEANDVVSLIGELVKLRLQAGLTQAEIAGKVGMTQPRVAEFESMDGRRVSLAFAARYARALGASIHIVPPGMNQ